MWRLHRTNSTLNILPSSQLNFLVSINGGTAIPLSTPVSGTLSTYIGQHLGVATGIQLNDASLGLNTMTGTAIVSGSAVIGTMTNPHGWLFGPDLKAIDATGHFDSGNLLFGLVNGSISTASTNPLLVLPKYSLFTHPLSLGTQAGVAYGQLSLTSSGNPAHVTCR